MKFTISATIPVVQYGNIQPTIELEGDDYETLKLEGLGKIQDIWDKYAEKPLKENEKGSWETLETFTGEQIQYNEETHQYKDMQGNGLVSGSAFSKRFEKPFDAKMIAGKVGEKNDIDPKLVEAVWSDNGKLSRMFGSAIHLAMENYFRHKVAGCGEKEYHKPKHPFLNLVVDTFPLKDEVVLPELLVSAVKNKMVGRIDGLVVTGEKKGYIVDYKSDASVEKNLRKHFFQLSFYGVILQKAGWEIEKLEIWNYTTVWEKYESEILDLKSVK